MFYKFNILKMQLTFPYMKTHKNSYEMGSFEYEQTQLAEQSAFHA
jgi:hypothetical protein